MQPFGEHGRPTPTLARRAALLTVAYGVVTNAAYFAASGAGPPVIFALTTAVPLLALIPFSVWRAQACPAEARGWLLLGGSHLLHVVARTLRVLDGSGVLAAGSMARVASVLLLGSAALIGLALLAWPLAPRDGNARRRQALDALVFAGALFFTLWALGWGALYRQAPGAPLDKAFTLAFPLTYIALTALAVYLGARRPGRFRGPLGWLALALFLSVAGNMAWGLLTLRGAYAIGHPIDLLSHLIPLLKVLATFSPRPVGDPAVAPAADWRGAAGEALPYLPVLPALGIGAWRLSAGDGLADPVLAWTAIAMVVLLLGRQALALRDVTRLSTGLEAQVAEQTRALRESTAVLVQTQRMNVVATLGAGLAHDFKNLLAVIHGSAEVAQLDLADGRAPRAADLEAIQVSSLKAAELASRLMALGRGQEGTLALVDLAAQVHESERLLRALAQPPIRLAVAAAPGPLHVRADPLKLQQVLVNLVANARDAMPSGGDLLVTAEREAAGTLLLRVRDGGTGMPPEVLARAFDPFFTTKAPGKGTGLGLASVKAIVESMGGTIEVHSEVGRGTTFALRLPAA